MANEPEWSDLDQDLWDAWSEPLPERLRVLTEIEDEVRFAWREAHANEFDGAQWEDVEREVRRRWELAFPDRGDEEWRMVAEEIRREFDTDKNWLY